jgi:hypothetical protein
MSQLKDFFSTLHWRFSSENDLSDFTWCVCETNESFRILFLKFFFPDVEFKKISKFNREFSKDNSRADFLITNDGIDYVIECKIGDRNHHFEQYLNSYDLSNDRLGYIVNYSFTKQGFSVKTWTEFYDYLISNLPSNNEEKEIFESYLEYLKNTCGIIKIDTKMDLKGINSLYSFNMVLKSVISKEKEDYKLSYYNTDFKESYYGYKFQVESKVNNKEDVWLNVGLWFNYENPVITIGVWQNKGWGKPFFDQLKNSKNDYSFKYSKKFYLDDSSFYFEGSDLFYKEFRDSEKPEDQKTVLENFVDEVVKFYVRS